ncbi:MAG: flagellar basal body P-ring protein FlgI [Candidatus Solibacter usitatus]|nr:flagellar basal body P-ring protein FlgI [Candidatus Solibacter usitatus]
MRAILSILLASGLLLKGAVRVKELASIEGIRDNQLIGYGLVVGLNGTGDKRQTFFSAQTLANLLDRMGVQVTPTAILVRNTAAVMLTATLPPFAQPGTRIDVQVAAIGDSTNLQGGLLVLTPLKSSGGAVFAAAQGPVLTGGFSAGRGGGNASTVNHPTAGRIPNGAIVEQAAPSVPPSGRLSLQLRWADFTTAARLVQAVNKHFSANLARAEHPGLVSVAIPAEWAQRTVQFVAEVEALSVDADRPARIVISERTGTITAGREIRIRPTAILHGNLTVSVETSYVVSQPEAFSDGKTTVVPQVNVAAKEEAAKSIQLKQGATVDDLVKALLAIGSTPRDIIAILQNLKTAGALEAEIEVI